jgi:hypothetical protein
MRTNRWIHLAMRALLAGVASSIVFAAAEVWAEDEVLLSMPEPPVDFFVYKEPMELDGKLAGQIVVVAKQESPVRVVITVETAFDRSTKPARIVGAKGYINGMAGTLKEMGMKLDETKLPDLENADFTTPVQADMTFTRPDGTKLYVRQFVFFSKYGYSVQVSAPDPQEVETLAKWAAHIKPAE